MNNDIKLGLLTEVVCVASFGVGMIIASPYMVVCGGIGFIVCGHTIRKELDKNDKNK